jgi:UDP-N-acetylglucosamine--N-acetylmuramyl-(pentapeptide) pyrophosphoryl-undecaprenol N-acetylglucosamine transferase
MTDAQPKPAVAIACGGTGGHLFPGLAVAEQLRVRGVAVTLLISPKEVDQQTIKAAQGMKVITLPAVAFQSGSRLAFFRGFAQAFRASRKLFREHPHRAALGMGGFTSAPPLLAARRGGVATFLHESNSVPGRANRWLARVVDGAFVGFPAAGKKLRGRNIVVTGTPVRSQFEPAPPAMSRLALGFHPDRPVVLVVGGSQGARGLNEAVVAALPLLAEAAPDAQWIHLTGPHDLQKVKAAYAAARLPAIVLPFFDGMDVALAAATVAVCRAGASSLAELAAMRVPAVLVPFPLAADNHQWHNARAFEESGAARLLEQRSATPEMLAQTMRELLQDMAAREQAVAALAAWHAPRAASDIAEAILQTASQKCRLGTVTIGGAGPGAFTRHSSVSS